MAKVILEDATATQAEVDAVLLALAVAEAALDGVNVTPAKEPAKLSTVPIVPNKNKETSPIG